MNDKYSGDLEYWKKRCKAVEIRMDQLEKEIIRLKGGRPLSKEEIKRHNQRVRDINAGIITSAI